MRRVSASQVTAFRRCQRYWYYGWVDRIRAPESEAQRVGKKIHSAIEHYLKNGEFDDEDPYVPFARAAAPFLPAPGSDRLLVEKEIHLVCGDGLPWWLGYIDIVDGENELGLTVLDFKSTIDFRWCKTPAELAEDPQLNSYGRWIFENEPSITSVRLAHLYLKKNRKTIPKKPKTKLVTMTVGLDHNMKVWEGCVSTVREMAAVVASVDNAEELPPTPTACGMFGGCFYQDKCGLTAAQMITAKTTAKGNRDMSTSFLQQLQQNNMTTAAPVVPTPAAEPAPAPAPAPATNPFLGQLAAPAPAAAAPPAAVLAANPILAQLAAPPAAAVPPALPAAAPPAPAAPQVPALFNQFSVPPAAAPAAQAPAPAPAVNALLGQLAAPPAAAPPAAAPPAALPLATLEQVSNYQPPRHPAAPAIPTGTLPPDAPSRETVPAPPAAAEPPAMETAPAKKKRGRPKKKADATGLALYIDCMPVKDPNGSETPMMFEDWMQPVVNAMDAHVLAEKQLGSHWMLPFAEQKALIAMGLTNQIAAGLPSAMVVNTSAPGAKDALNMLVPHAVHVVRGLR